MSNKTKENGVVYTPNYIVKLILDQSEYEGNKILGKHVIDNSCGDGAFLIEIVTRYIQEFNIVNQRNIFAQDKLKAELETYIHGIELDEVEVIKCKDNLDQLVKKFGIENVNWDINQGDTLKVTRYSNKMDYVLGNPPYVRVHNLKENFDNVKERKFTKGGMTDLFILFYELGLDMLNENGILGYITPSSIFNSLAGRDFRKYVIENKLLTSVIDFKHFQVFPKFTTYTCILTLDKKNSRNIVEYNMFDEIKSEKVFIEFLKYEDFNLNDSWYFGQYKDLLELKNILNVDIKNKNIEVKNGFATLSDKIFIREEFEFESKYIYPITKASSKKEYKVIYPYDEEGKPVDFDLFEEELKEYFNTFADNLKNRSLDKGSPWYVFGRSQGVKDFWKKKISINSLLRTKKDIKIKMLNPGEGIYSGLYIVGDFDFDLIKKILLNDDFVNYISMLGKYKSGGYYTFSSADLKKYLVYKIEGRKREVKFLEAIKRSFLVSLETSPRSNEKLKVLHGFIAEDLQKRLGNNYVVKSLGFQDGKEAKILGRYMTKNVDITIKKDGKAVAGIAVKFVMSNYSQNSNNYFENMLGETANIRANKIPYFQIFIVPEVLPYYKQNGEILKWERITENNVDKYVKMSNDQIDAFYHTPNKTLFTIVDLGEFIGTEPKTFEEYKEYFSKNNFSIKYSDIKIKFNDQTIYNDYELFIEKVFHSILAL